MSNPPLPAPPTALSPTERMFPLLTPAQIERIARQGCARTAVHGEVLFDAGTHSVPFFVITAGQVEINRATDRGEEVIVVLGAGQFTGEVNMLSGRRSLVRARVSQPGEVIELNHPELLALLQTDYVISEILMRAFILRRVELIEHGFGDAVLIGSTYCAGTLRVKEFLTRNGHPYTYLDLDQDADVQAMLDRFHASQEDVPVLICRGEIVLRHPSNHQIAECLGLNESIDETQLRDVIIVGAGPAGLAAAVYAASEGLDVLVLETNSPGGQAGSSSKIENYLGFPNGISGGLLSARAYTQAQKFGVQLLIAVGAQNIVCQHKPYVIEIDDGRRVSARTVIIATGAEYHKPPLNNLAQFEGTGVYYGATFMEAQLCVNEEVIVVGGGNSAGQAAVFLAQGASKVYLLVRSSGLAESMSRYLVRRIEEHPAISLKTCSELIALEGENHLERVQWRDNNTAAVESHKIRHVFVMAGARPSTHWLGDCVMLDDKGFVKTGADLSEAELSAGGWPLARPPHLLETNLPGVFAVGDARAGNIKRVASAVGEGSIAIAFVHQVLQE